MTYRRQLEDRVRRRARTTRQQAINQSRTLLEALRDTHGEAGRPDLAPGAVRRP
jgi:hypothetical protein